MIKHIDSYTRIALKDTVHIFTGVLLYSFIGVLFHGQGAETCFFGELWTFSRFRRKIDEVHLSQKLMGHMNLHTEFRDEGGKYDPPYLFIKVFQNLRNSAKSINKYV